MQSTGLVRVTIATPLRRVDMALPEQAAVAEILPGLLARAGEGLPDRGAAAGGWLLRRADGTAFDLDRTLGAHRVRDGEVLHLTERRVEWPELEYDDLADAIATGAGRGGRTWGPRHTRRAGLAVGAAAALVALVAVLRAGPPWSGPAQWALGAAGVLLVAGVVVARAVGDAVLGAVLAAVALPFAAVGGGLLLVGDAPLTSGANGSAGLLTTLSAGNVLLAGAALLLAALVGYLGVVAAPAVFAGAAVVGLLGVVAGWLASTDALAGDRAAAVVGAAVLVGSTGFAPLALRLARVPMPVLPRSTADLVRDDPQPPLALVHAAVARADALLTGLVGGACLAAVNCEVALVRAGGTAGVALAGVLAVGFLLRARLYPVVRQRVPLLVAGVVGVGCLAVGPLLADPGTRLVLAGPVLLLAAAVVLAAGVLLSTRPANPYLGRVAEYAEIVVLLSVVPVACAVLGLYGYVRGLGG
jgi:type VII secretion integral membrane protein EccD